ncbi:MAG: AAA family ATPase [Anaerolineales bacterium]
MSFAVAVAGKGGTGKTSIAALTIHWLLENRGGAVLAIDADPACNLNQALGLPLPTTLGEIREELGERANAGGLEGITKMDFLDREVRMAVEEGDRVDLLVMGRPEGVGCYCAVNHLLRQILDKVSHAYDYIVIDNEAGMEHLSRRTTQDVDVLLLATDPSLRGVRTAEAMATLSRSLGIKVGRTVLVLNRIRGPLPVVLDEALRRIPAEVVGQIPEDPLVTEFDGAGRPLFELDGESPAFRAVSEMAGRLFA